MRWTSNVWLSWLTSGHTAGPASLLLLEYIHTTAEELQWLWLLWGSQCHQMMLHSGQAGAEVLNEHPELERHLEAEILKLVQRQQTVTLGSLGGKNAEQVSVHALLGG